jgi:hypothetical protein
MIDCMFRLTFTSVLLLSIGAASQTAAPVDGRPQDADQASTSTAAKTSLELPEAPGSIAGRPTTPPGARDASQTRFGSPTPAEQRKLVKGPRTMDSKFILLQALSAAALVADVETTMHDLQGHTAGELNPLFGQHPTRPRLYGINVPLNALSFFVSYRLKKSAPEQSLWKVGPALSIAVHTAATINNLIVAHR